jgi:hypothetical protein
MDLLSWPEINYFELFFIYILFMFILNFIRFYNLYIETNNRILWFIDFLLWLFC